LREQHRRHRRQDLGEREREQVARVAANQQHDQKHASYDRDRDERLEQSIRHELDKDDVPVGRGHKSTALKAIFD
jgi:hypothetical protein